MLEQGVKPDWSPKDREEYLSQRLELTSAASGLSGLRREFSQPVFALAGMVGLVLLIACANVASLQLARAVTRQRELAVRRALGAGRIRLVQQLMAESVLLALGGGGLGLLLACWLRDIIGALVSSGPGHVQIDLQLDLRAIGFTLTASLLTTVVFGLVPALRATRLDLAPSLKDDPRALGPSAERARLGKALVVAQVVLSVVLIFGAGLFVRTLRNLETLDPGFNRENVLLFTVDPTLGGYKGQQVADLYRRVLERLDSVPGVRSASLSAITPMWGGKWYAEVWAEGYTAQLNENVFVDLNSVGPNFFETLRIPYLLGRDFGPHDNEKSTKVAVVNKAMARYFFGAQNPIGKKLGWIEGSERKEFEVIGVVGDAKYVDLREQPPQTVYLNCFQDTLGPMSFEVRTASRAAPLVSEIRKVVEAIGKDAQVSGFRTLDEQANESLAHERLIASLAGFFGTLALTLAAVGLYGTMAYTVQRRTNEIGIRMALGAQRGDVLGMILKETLALVLIGACIGLPAALATARLISSMLFGLKPNDPAAVLLPLLVLGVTAAVAGYLPARRASRVDPMVALRYE